MPKGSRIPIATGIAGHVVQTGQAMNIPDAYASPLFNREVDLATGYRTGSVLCVPILDRTRHPFAVMMLLNKRGGEAFDARDEQALRVFAASIGIILETWNEARKMRRSQRPASAAAGGAG